MKARFDAPVAGGGAAVRGLAGEPEMVDFDCKLKTDPTRGAENDEDKRTLGKTLSAFANSMGGAASDTSTVDATVEGLNVTLITCCAPTVNPMLVSR